MPFRSRARSIVFVSDAVVVAVGVEPRERLFDVRFERDRLDRADVAAKNDSARELAAAAVRLQPADDPLSLRPEVRVSMFDLEAVELAEHRRGQDDGEPLHTGEAPRFEVRIPGERVRVRHEDRVALGGVVEVRNQLELLVKRPLGIRERLLARLHPRQVALVDQLLELALGSLELRRTLSRKRP